VRRTRRAKGGHRESCNDAIRWICIDCGLDGRDSDGCVAGGLFKKK
jgi:hypothetical protein